MKVVALLNPVAGGVGADGPRHMKGALQRAGLHGAEVVELDRGDSDGQMRKLLQQCPDLFIVWGGDGTHRSALSVIGREAANLLLLPGGTMSLLSKSLHGNRTWQRILRDVVAHPVERVLPAGQINSDLFYCAMLAGAPVRFAEARESLRRGDIPATFNQIGAAFEALQSMRLHARYVGAYQFGDGRLPTTSVIGAMVGPMSRNGRMEVAALAHPTAVSALDGVWASLASSWRDTAGVTIVTAEELVIDGEGAGDIPVLIDGEALKAGRRVRVVYIAEAAFCLTAG